MDFQLNFHSLLTRDTVQVEGLFYVNESLKSLMYEELRHHSAAQGEHMCRYSQQTLYLLSQVLVGSYQL